MLQTIGFVLLLLTCTSTFFINTHATELKTYIVHVTSSQNQPHENIEQRYNSFLSKVASKSNEKLKPEMVFAYRHAITGFAAKMSPDQAKVMERLNGVLSVKPESVFQLYTTHSPHFLGLSQNSGVWKHSNYGKGVIIGLIDTGITPGHPSFNDHGVPPPPSTWKGKCEVAGCNNKLIGIRNFINESKSPTDDVGHGTHTASTAAGNFVDNANVFGLGNGTVSGMAPLAHLAIYKVCFMEGCSNSAILAGMDAAIDDGVHVLSISLGGAPSVFYNDDLAVATFSAIQKGIFVSCAAGNSGPSKTSLSNEAPWILTVGASTIDRRFRTSVVLGNKKIFHGESLYQPKDTDHKLRPLIYPVKEGEDTAWCEPESLDHIDVKGKVVLCDVGGLSNREKGEVVKKAGGAAMIIANNILIGETTSAGAHVILASYVGYKEGVEIKKYLNSTTSPVASIVCAGTVVGLKSDPEMVFFSSRGPSYASPGILKPDITGPGLNILAAWHESVDHKKGTKAIAYNVISGTSMSCPHLAGVAALLKSAHPDWSPAAIKSAIMTTASQVNRNGSAILDERGLPADVLTTGSGHVYPQKALEPGLVFDIQPDDYIPYLCGLGYPPQQIQIIVKKNVTCSKTIQEGQLNYPSFTVSLKRGERRVFTRTVTNVGLAYSSYAMKEVSVPKGVTVNVMVDNNEDVLSFNSVQQTRTYEVTFTRDDEHKMKRRYGQGYMTWVSDSGKCAVKTTFSFKFE